MSLSISPSLPAAQAACAAGAKGDPAGLPFDLMLGDQVAAAADDTTANGEVDKWFGAALEAAETATARPADADPLAGVLAGLGMGVRRLLAGNRQIGDAAATLNALGKDKPANDKALLLLAAHDLLQRLESLQFVAAGGPAFSTANTGADAAAEDQVPSNALRILSDDLLASLKSLDVATVQPPADSDSAPADLTTELGDLLATLAAETGPSDQAHLPDAALSRRADVPPGLILAQAIHAALGKGAFADPDQGSNQPSTWMGLDRRSTKSAAPAIRVAEPLATFDAALKASASTYAAAPLPNQDGVLSSIVQTMRLQMRDGVGTAVVHLEPDFLGAVSIELRVENGAVTATLRADNPQVRAWMEANEGALRESLAGQGLSLDRLLVTDERIADDRSSGRRHQQEQEQHARQRPRRDDTSTFEVIV